MKGAIFCILLVCFFISSCKKNKDENAPSITISSPLRNSTVDAGNYIHLVAKVTDDKKLESVTLKVLSLDGNTQIAEGIGFSVSGKELNIDQTIAIGDIHTVSGTYQIIMEAFDGTNKKKEYCEIIVNEIPRVFKKMIVVHKSGTGFAIDSLVGASFVNFVNGTSDFSSASISNYYQQMYFAGNTQGVLEAFNLQTNTVAWTIPADIPMTTAPLFYFNEYNSSELTFWQSFASTASGKLKAISSSGNTNKIFTMQVNQFASCMVTTSTHIIVGESPLLASGSSYLTYYFKNGFSIDHTVAIPFTPKKIFVLSDHELVVVGNNGSQGELRIYDNTTNGFWEQVVIPTGKIYDAIQLNADEYIISHESGLLKFQHATTNLYNMTSGNKAQMLTYNDISSTLYAGEGNLIKVYDPNTGALAGSYPCVDSVKAILFHYNK